MPPGEFKFSRNKTKFDAPTVHCTVNVWLLYCTVHWHAVQYIWHRKQIQYCKNRIKYTSNMSIWITFAYSTVYKEVVGPVHLEILRLTYFNRFLYFKLFVRNLFSKKTLLSYFLLLLDIGHEYNKTA